MARSKEAIARAKRNYLARHPERRAASVAAYYERNKLDHIMPIALGGRTEDANLQLLCPPCNRSKGAKHPDDFARQIRSAA